MWQRRAEQNVLYPVAFFFRHTTGFFADRENIIKPWGEENLSRAQAGFDLLENRLAESEYLPGSDVSIADITALCSLDFATFVGLDPLADRPSLNAWHTRVSGRPSAQA